MGDRLRVVFKSEDNEGNLAYSPVSYHHWGGSYFVERHAEWLALMDGRMMDLEYAAARWIGVCHSHLPGNLSLGVSNLTQEEHDALDLNEPEVIAKVFSHGDAGFVLVDVADGSWKGYGGYLDGPGKPERTDY